MQTTITYGADFSEAVQADGIYGYINGGDYAGDVQDRLVKALMSELQDEVNERLPEAAHWTPSTSEFLHEVGAEMPDHDEMKELFESAWSAVEARYDEIETEALA